MQLGKRKIWVLEYPFCICATMLQMVLPETYPSKPILEKNGEY